MMQTDWTGPLVLTLPAVVCSDRQAFCNS